MNTGQGIGDLIHDAEVRHISPDAKYGEDVTIRKWSNLTDALKTADQILNQEKILSHGSSPESVIPFTSDLVYFQLFIGASRARLKVFLLVEENVLQD